MEFAANTLDPESMYKLLTGIVVPRPIAWVTTLSRMGGEPRAVQRLYLCLE